MTFNSTRVDQKIMRLGRVEHFNNYYQLKYFAFFLSTSITFQTNLF